VKFWSAKTRSNASENSPIENRRNRG